MPRGGLASLTLVSALAVKLLLNHEAPLKVVSIAVILLVASIPIAMQVVCTSTMAVGAHKLAKAKALVCKLTAIEELAAMDVHICLHGSDVSRRILWIIRVVS